MIKKDCVKRLERYLDELFAENGIAVRPPLEPAGGELCALRLPEKVDAQHPGALKRIADRLMSDGKYYDDVFDAKCVPLGPLPPGGYRFLAIEAPIDRTQDGGGRDELAFERMHFWIVGPEDGDQRDPRTALLPIPAPKRNAPDTAYLVLSYAPFDEIERGEKRTEFRAYSPSYVRKLLSSPVRRVRFQRGYSAGARQMVFEVEKIDLYDRLTRKSADPRAVPEGFFPTDIAIDLGRRIIV